MFETRKALMPKTELILDKDKKIIINREIGRGASCIVYDADYLDNIETTHKIRIKEFYPAYLNIERIGNALSPNPKDNIEYKNNLERFKSSYKKNIEIRNTTGLTNSTINSIDVFSANNTMYIYMSMDEGDDYTNYIDSLYNLTIFLKYLSFSLFFFDFHFRYWSNKE